MTITPELDKKIREALLLRSRPNAMATSVVPFTVAGLGANGAEQACTIGPDLVARWDAGFVHALKGDPNADSIMVKAYQEALQTLEPGRRARAYSKLRAELSKVSTKARDASPPPGVRHSIYRFAEELQSGSFVALPPREYDKDLEAWDDAPKVLQYNANSRLHALREAIAAGQVALFSEEADWLAAHRPDEAMSFVVQHDWARAFASADGFNSEDEIQAPFDHNAFEFYVSGRAVITLVSRSDVPIFTLCQSPGNIWYGCTSLVRDGTDIESFCFRQTKAICVALDAEIAVKEAIRAPEKLNRSRAARGRLPLKGHHLVHLNRRSRTSPLARDAIGEAAHKKRMHFVRGHWRHFDNYKTWIKWHLRGDPDLGFIDKEYRL